MCDIRQIHPLGGLVQDPSVFREKVWPIMINVPPSCEGKGAVKRPRWFRDEPGVGRTSISVQMSTFFGTSPQLGLGGLGLKPLSYCSGYVTSTSHGSHVMAIDPVTRYFDRFQAGPL